MQRVDVTISSAATLLLLVCLSGCNVYDANRITGPGQPLVPAPMAPLDAGSGTGVRPDTGTPAEPSDAGSDVADAQAPSPIPIDTTHCGDGRVTGTEKCDIGLAPGAPGACPTECPELAPCVPRALNNGSTCQAECVVLQLLCKDGDECCPGNCTDKNDSDCSSDCGDGVIQPEQAETCESESMTPCKTSDAQCDDLNACTVDKLVGSVQNCNASCTNTRITDAKDGDGCCPEGTDANSDRDCKPVCGNGVREGSEACDGSEGCSPQCMLSMPQLDQMRCLEKFGSDGDACARCSCMNCSTSYLLCRDSPDAAKNELCNSVLTCAKTNDCFGTACYCGGAFFCTPPSGECRAEVEAATESTDPTVVSARANDTNYAVGRAYAADTCRTSQCPMECRQ